MEQDLELRKHIAQLEDLVNAQTAALTEVRAQLEQAIVERQQAEAEQERLLAAERAHTRRPADFRERLHRAWQAVAVAVAAW